MSVLVEALSLIVPRKVLDVRYPGGTDAFMLKMCDPEVPSRLVCADDQLVSVSFHGTEEAQVVGAELLELGIVAVNDDRFQELAFVDQARGPTLPCDWLEWRRHPDGFTYCWMSGTDPDAMHAPDNWTPEQSRALTWHDYRDEPGRCMQLAAEDGKEAWIDFRTGAIMEGLPPRAPDESGAMRAEHGAYSFFYAADDASDYVGIVGGFGSFVPSERRVAVAELLSRINVRLRIGNFQLDFDDGGVRYRIGYDVEDGTFSRAMADNLLGCALGTMDMYHEALMRVAFGGADPEAALAAVTE